MNHDFERRRVLKSSGEVLGSYCQRCGHLVAVSPSGVTLDMGEKMHKCNGTLSAAQYAGQPRRRSRKGPKQVRAILRQKIAKVRTRRQRRGARITPGSK